MIEKSARFRVGILANVVSIFSAFCWIPLPRFVEFCLTRSLGDHSPAPHLAALLSYMVWILYGFVHPNSILLITSNVTCSLIVLYHLLLFTICSKSWNNVRRKVFALVILEIVFVGIVATTVLTLVHDTKLRSHIIGMIAMICQLGTYAYPISYMKLTITTRDLDHLNVLFATLSILSTTFWATYACDPPDWYLIVPNVVGCFLAVMELCLEGSPCGSYSHKSIARNLEFSRTASSPNGSCDVEVQSPISGTAGNSDNMKN
ncbi:hypothetical protein Droror1_Dr00010186 [Drosera rotundifolia]